MKEHFQKPLCHLFVWQQLTGCQSPSVLPTLLGVTHKEKKQQENKHKVTVLQLQVRSEIHTSIGPQAGDIWR